MSDRDSVMERIRLAFGATEFPGAGFLQGSFDGCEPYDEVGPFQDKTEWQSIPASFLDTHADALSFFSEAGFRFFLPAYLIADLQGELQAADPLFHLTHGFSDMTVPHAAGNRVYIIKSGKGAFLNPRRYGALTWYDRAQYRLSVFTREEACAIVAYLEFKRERDQELVDREAIDAALDLFWLERARAAPTAHDLQVHQAEQEAYLAAISAAGTLGPE